MSIYARLLAILLGISSAAIYAAPEDEADRVAAAAAGSPALDPGMDMSQVIALLQQQQQELAAAACIAAGSGQPDKQPPQRTRCAACADTAGERGARHCLDRDAARRRR